LHNLPEEFAMAVPAAAVRSKRVLYGAAALSALAEPVGAAVGLAAVGVAPALNGAFLAFAAGAMLFVSVHELVPMARRHGNAGSFAGGAALSVLAYALLSRIPSAVFAAGPP
jgi:ZIP family zinc transporter